MRNLSMNNLIIRPASQEDMEQIIQFNQAMALETENKTLNLVTLKAGVKNLFAQPQYGFTVWPSLRSGS